MKKKLKLTKSVYSNKQNTLPRSNQLLGGSTMVSAFQRIHNWKEHIHAVLEDYSGTRFQVQNVVFYFCFQTLGVLCLCIDYSKILLERIVKTCILQYGRHRCVPRPWVFNKAYYHPVSCASSPVICSIHLAYCCLLIEQFTFTKNVACLALISRLLICI